MLDSQYVALFMLNVLTLHNVVVSSTEVQQGCFGVGEMCSSDTVKSTTFPVIIRLDFLQTITCSLILLLDLD